MLIVNDFTVQTIDKLQSGDFFILEQNQGVVVYGMKVEMVITSGVKPAVLRFEEGKIPSIMDDHQYRARRAVCKPKNYKLKMQSDSMLNFIPHEDPSKLSLGLICASDVEKLLVAAWVGGQSPLFAVNLETGKCHHFQRIESAAIDYTPIARWQIVAEDQHGVMRVVYNQ